MKEKIHPKFYEDALVSCACGETFKTGSTMPALKVDICSKCHPFFTGKTKIMDTAGRIEKFQKKHANTVIENAKPKKRVVRKPEAKPEVKNAKAPIKAKPEAAKAAEEKK